MTMTPAYRYSAEVLRIVDGDTAVLRVDCGFRVWIEDSFRFYGINAPEVVGETKAAGLAAKAYLESLIPAGTSVIVETFKPKDKYGRWLAIVYATVDGVEDVDVKDVDVNALMLSSGNAVAYYG